MRRGLDREPCHEFGADRLTVGSFPAARWRWRRLIGFTAACRRSTCLVKTAAHHAQRCGGRAQAEARELRRTLAAAEALIKAEPQVLMHWEPGKGLSVVTNTLTGVPGLPASQLS